VSKTPSSTRVRSPDNREMIIRAIDGDKTIRKTFILALAREDQGDLPGAEPVYKKVIEDWKTVQKHEDQVVLFCQDKLTSILRDCGQYHEAERLCRLVFKKTKSLDKGHCLIMQSAGSLALILRDRGQYREAYDIIHDILMEAQYPLRDIAHVRLISVLAKVVNDLGIGRLSLFLARNVLSACEELLGPHHPFTLDQASNLALVLTEQGQLRFAEEIDRRVLKMLEGILGTDHPQSLYVTKRLANNLSYQTKDEHATRLLNER
jgi:tetratricopeptide (TPR) repeat protein